MNLTLRKNDFKNSENSYLCRSIASPGTAALHYGHITFHRLRTIMEITSLHPFIKGRISTASTSETFIRED